MNYQIHTIKRCYYIFASISWLIYAVIAVLTVIWSHRYGFAYINVDIVINLQILIGLAYLTNIFIKRTTAYVPIKAFNKYLDSTTFKGIVHEIGRFRCIPEYRALSAYYTGDYQTAVNILTYRIMGKRARLKVKLFCLTYLARSYFEMGDYAKLKDIVDKYNQYKERYSSRSVFKKSHTLFDYFEFYLANDFESCKAISKEKVTVSFNLHAGANLNTLECNFLYAIACYADGNMQKAKSAFENIIFKTSKTHFADISQKYVIAIENNCQIEICEQEILPDSKNNSYVKKADRLRFIKRIAAFACAIIIVLVSGCFGINAYVQTYQYKVESYLYEEYGPSRIYLGFYINSVPRIVHNKIHNDSSTGIKNYGLAYVNGKLMFCDIYTSPDDSIFRVNRKNENVIIGQQYYCETNYCSFYYSVLPQLPLYTDNINYAVEFKFKFKTYYFCITNFQSIKNIDSK